MPRISHMLLK